jgi:hypothetical protein
MLTYFFSLSPYLKNTLWHPYSNTGKADVTSLVTMAIRVWLTPGALYVQGDNWSYGAQGTSLEYGSRSAVQEIWLVVWNHKCPLTFTHVPALASYPVRILTLCVISVLILSTHVGLCAVSHLGFRLKCMNLSFRSCPACPNDFNPSWVDDDMAATGQGHNSWTVVSGVRRDVDETCCILGYYAASSGSPLPTFWDNISVPSSRVKESKKKPLKMGPIRCPKTLVKDYHSTLRNPLKPKRICFI